MPAKPEAARKRLLVFIVAYNAEKTIESVLTRIRSDLGVQYDVEVLVLDDQSKDATFDRAESARHSRAIPFKLHVLANPVNQGYGGNQKIGFHYAIDQGFDFVALVHGDGQYAPECLEDLVRPIAAGEAEAVFGSRMMTPLGALKGGMPLYKYAGNKILTWIENRMLGMNLSEFHSGYRVYSVAALKRIPFDLNTLVFHFDTEIIVQLHLSGARIKEVPIPTYYGDEVCHVNGLKYAWDVVKTVIRARLQRANLFYDPKFDCVPEDQTSARYVLKTGYESPHSLALALVPPGKRVLDVGCAGGGVGAAMRERSTHVVGIDVFPLAKGIVLDGFFRHDLNSGNLPVQLEEFDYVLLLDVIEHLQSPEAFVSRLRDAVTFAPRVKFLVSTGNVAFAIPRMMLLLGQFNYGKRGILDLTHTRLFTFASLRRLLEQQGFNITLECGVPAPFPLAVGDGFLGRLLLGLNRLLIRISRTLFAYQIFMQVEPRPSLAYLLREAHEYSRERVDAIAAVAGRR